MASHKDTANVVDMADQAIKNNLGDLELAADGDVVIVPSDNDSAKTRVRVSSVLLGYASPVFKAMFTTSRFSEGCAAKSATHPAELQLPQDSVQGMSLLLKTLHYHPIEQDIDLDTMEDDADEFGVPRESTQAIAALAISAHKYDCIGIIKPIVSTLVRNFIACMRASLNSTPKVIDVTVGAYLLELAEEFTLLTREMVLHATGAFSAVMSNDYKDFLPTMLYLLLEEQRAAARNALLNHLLNLEHIPCSVDFCYGMAMNSGFLAWFIDDKIERSSVSKHINNTELGFVLADTWSSEEFESVEEFNCQHSSRPATVTQGLYREICTEVNAIACDLCLPCTIAGKTAAECAHVGQLKLDAAKDRIHVYDF